MRLEGKPHPGNIAVGIVQKPLMRHEWAAYRIAGNRLLSLELEVPLFAAEQNVGERSFVWHEIKSGTGEPAVVPGRGVRAEIPIRSPSYSFGCRCKPLPRRRPTCPIDPAHPMNVVDPVVRISALLREGCCASDTQPINRSDRQRPIIATGPSTGREYARHFGERATRTRGQPQLTGRDRQRKPIYARAGQSARTCGEAL